MAHEESGGISRRTVLAGAGLLAASAATSTAAPSGKLKVAIFSKHLQFVKGEELPAPRGGDRLRRHRHHGAQGRPRRTRTRAQELPGLVASSASTASKSR